MTHSEYENEISEDNRESCDGEMYHDDFGMVCDKCNTNY